MPISRYEIRNEYTLADPELYRAADKDDPEALLEGVAMAGLVGVLRQLGDLAEFAADIFHNLHEDVMATAARGHTLAVRVQQLENEIPSVERAFLSQTDHSSFFYHPGVDWHHNLQPKRNLVTEGDMPRFIMDSYEECRGPPRLFLLDKFDVAGAGACLKRYTDPSFFKVENSEMTTAEIQWEKKIRKTKKKGLRWKNRETPEVFPTSHTKLHQLFLEERVGNDVSNPSRRAKLKRRLNGFPFNSRSGKSYMQEILQSLSPDHEVLHDMTGDSTQLKLATNDHNEFGSENFECRPVSPDTDSGGRKRSNHFSPDIEGVAQLPPMSDPYEYPTDDKIIEVSSSHLSIAADGMPSLDKVPGEKAVAVDAESNREESLTGYESDDMASEIDNYVDAPSTMESELDRDFDLRMKNDNTSAIKMESLIIDASYEEPLQSRSSDSQSTGDSTMSDMGNDSCTKEISSSTSDSPDISTEKSQSENLSTYQETVNEDLPVDHHPTHVVSDDACTKTDAITFHRSSDLDEVERSSKPTDLYEKVSTLHDEEENTYRVVGPSPVVSDGTCIDTNGITNHGCEFEQVTSTLCMNGSMPTLELSDPEEALGNFELEAPESDEIVSKLDDSENINLVIDPPCSPKAALGSQTEDDLSISSDREQLVDEPNGESKPCLSAVHIYHHTTDSSVKTSSLDEDESDPEDRKLMDDAASTLNVHNVLSETRIPDEFVDKFPEVPEKSPFDHPDAANNGDNIEPKGDNLIVVRDDEDSNVPTDSLNHSLCIMDASPVKGINETLLVSACALNFEDSHSSSSIDNEVSLGSLKLSHLANSPDSPMDGCIGHEEGIFPKEDTAVNGNHAPEIPEPSEVVGLQGTGISYYVPANDSESLERHHCTSEDLEEPAGTSDDLGVDEILLCSVSNAREVNETTSPADPSPANEIHVLLNKSGSEADRSKSTDITSHVSTVSDEGSIGELVEEHSDRCEDSGIDQLENGNNFPMEYCRKLDLVEEVGSTEASASGFGTIGCDSVDEDHPATELSGSAPNSHHDLELVDHSPEFVPAAKISSPIEQCVLDREQELSNESSLQNHVPDASTLPFDKDVEESVQDDEEPVQDNIGSPPSHLDQNVPHPVEISSDLSSLPPVNHLQILDGNDDDDDGKGESNSVSAVSLANGSSPSISELSRLSSYEINVPVYPKDPLGFIPSASNPFLETDQINLADLPPLPPLPPVQWRMGKLQHALPSADEETIRNEESFPQLISLPAPTDDDDSTLLAKPTHDCASPPIASTDAIISLHEEMKDSVTELAAETILKEENPNSVCSSLDAETLHETSDNPPKIEDKPQLLAAPISESVSTSSAAEDGAENESQKVKFPRLPNPLVDDVSFLDKSKLRKVTERARPEIPKVDERDSLLEQIRTKSFNLRPAMASRPSIRDRGGPNTNLKVVAILEKANAIRQALAGSDEDDDDSWSE